MPATRCVIDAIAVMGKLKIEICKFTGLLSTVKSHLANSSE
jgi:hypothetical protein